MGEVRFALKPSAGEHEWNTTLEDSGRLIKNGS
jgi:hypothetical protein